MQEPAGAEASGCWSRGGVGCVTFVAGFFSGGMIGVLVSKAVASFTNAPGCEGIPTCDWHVYMLAGGAIGAITLPAIALWRLRRK